MEKMEHAAREHKQFGNIDFKFIEVGNAKKAVIQISQGKSTVQHDKKRLIEIAHETIDPFMPGWKIHVQPIVYLESPAASVTPEWVKNKMISTGTKLKDLAHDTGLDYTSLSGVINESKPLTQVMKALFYYYFIAKSASKGKREQ